MISLQKLEKLPRHQRLRKIEKLCSRAEHKICRDILTTADLTFFAAAAGLLAEDSLFSAEAGKLFKDAAVVFASVGKIADTDTAAIRHALNNVKHILLTETGRDQSDWDFTGNEGKLDPAKRQVFEGMQVYFEDIRSPFNVGAMFRTAESFGAEKIFLSPFCADPLHRRAQRTAMGCIDIVPWERQNLSEELSKLNRPVFALETGGIPVNEFSFPQRGLLITGSEELGVSPSALSAADASLGRVSIPCYGAKGSLNVSVAFGIAMQAWAQKLKVT